MRRRRSSWVTVYRLGLRLSKPGAPASIARGQDEQALSRGANGRLAFAATAQSCKAQLFNW
jgi:hypothetical protein